MKPFVIETYKVKMLAEAAGFMLDANNVPAARLILSGLLTELEVADLRGICLPRGRRPKQGTTT